VSRLTRAILPVWYAILIRPKEFFGTIGRAGGPMPWNAVALFAVALAIYVSLQTMYEEALIHFLAYECATFVGYYAWEYEALGRPLAHVAAFFTIFVHFAALGALGVVNVAASTWLLLRWFVHFGETTSFKAILVAVLYAASFVTITFCMLSPLLILLSGRDDPTALLYFFGPMTTPGEPRYELALAYVYARAVAFTTNIMLHWGLTFTVLLLGGIAWSGRFI
jgi:hypothetical protein